MQALDLALSCVIMGMDLISNLVRHSYFIPIRQTRTSRLMKFNYLAKMGRGGSPPLCLDKSWGLVHFRLPASLWFSSSFGIRVIANFISSLPISLPSLHFFLPQNYWVPHKAPLILGCDSPMIQEGLWSHRTSRLVENGHIFNMRSHNAVTRCGHYCVIRVWEKCSGKERRQEASQKSKLDFAG